MLEEIIIAGFGGQGVLSLGMTLAYAGMIEDKEVSWMPSYGPEMRGGTANCMTILSDEPISSPVIHVFDTAIVLNQPSMEKFGRRLKPGGLLIYEEGSILKPMHHADAEVIAIPAAKMAHELGMSKAMNMVILGAYLALKSVVTTESVEEALHKVLPEKYHVLIPKNLEALKLGAAFMQEQANLANVH